ncbi:hypothetical protein GCM10017783_18640 [Deinococcus piscis]|uniref:SnoaL-like domain-containing protein n=1 Tax=Deinococcus piscis TaxID=394230 RepID=A0ABQ3K6X3_9DEIO|nr:nuclear transport factor 2 family protein [Deinococcus piscis]GHG06310.1 hypothetical protein GCM10017783_18640 [Deinococcus piscis]
MTEQEARELIERLFGVIDGTHFDELGQVFAQEAVYERPGYEPLRGLDRIEQFYRYERIIGAGQHQVAAVTCSAAGDAVAVGLFRGESRDGQPLKERFADVYRVSGGKIIHRTTYFFRAAI